MIICEHGLFAARNWPDYCEKCLCGINIPQELIDARKRELLIAQCDKSVCKCAADGFDEPQCKREVHHFDVDDSGRLVECYE